MERILPDDNTMEASGHRILKRKKQNVSSRLHYIFCFVLSLFWDKSDF